MASIAWGRERRGRGDRRLPGAQDRADEARCDLAQFLGIPPGVNAPARSALKRDLAPSSSVRPRASTSVAILLNDHDRTNRTVK
ncbi:hypothetical protein [Brytella acorum]|uniref:Uncharacterized protein n=1 Tax=Brytella acorum TaxID=2959299 RepID=A0AA35VAJ2_9PROT|nr:hypothetical protein [Brytella acorum]MDF3623684.1 hypothetical protein [Brytella acorum]CAI9119898.1 hypothetical protein LMG32879_000724 [Brytella acorum]